MKKYLIVILAVVFFLQAETLFQVKDSLDRVVLDVSTDGLRVYNEGDLLMEISSSDIRAFIEDNPAKGLARSFSVTTSSNIKGQADVLEVTTQDTKMREGDQGQHYTDFGPRNMFLGLNAGFATTPSGTTSGQDNIFIGNYSGVSNSSGYKNIFIGAESGRNNINSNDGMFIGYKSGYNNTATSNMFIGNFSGEANISGFLNTYLGHYSGKIQQTGMYNTYIGYESGGLKTGGNYNTFVGNLTGQNNGSGSGNVFIGNGAGGLENGSNKLYIANTSTSTPLIFGDFTSGRIGLGTTTLSHRLEVYDNVIGPMARFKNDGDNFDRHGIRIDAGPYSHAGDHWFIRCFTGNGSHTGSIRSNNGTMSFFNTSDIKLKKNVRTSQFSALQIIKGLRVVDFQWKDNKEDPELFSTGYIAQEALEILPAMVTEDPESGYLGLSTEYLIPVLHKAIQEQQEEISDLKIEVIRSNKENEKLLARIEAIEALLNK